ncbi:transcriptional regulator [Shewanella psychrophila]|uniref:Transcriptional regulator n=1 Tax=Shewanella psychrophila TaxID=225848 RepID=A0A1S6HX61_9GAMM|nr:LysR family transcriptional regulator [Shewanella psychrophila]AQS40081.1 transcriptional regulator [Shewanella psychrophila]
MQNINDMLVFSEVIKAGSFTKAATVLNLPKSNISRKLTRLETHLGVRLIERTTRSIHLTEVGQIYLQHCQRIQEEVESAELCVDHLVESPRGQLKICVSVTIGQQIISKYLSDYIEQYPDVDVSLELTNRRIDLVEEGFDLAIRIGELEDSSIIAKYLGQLERKLCASPSLIDKHMLPFHPTDLAQLPCLFMTSGMPKNQWLLRQADILEQIQVKPKVELNDFLSLSHLCISGCGVTMLPSYLCDEAIDEGNLLHILPDWQCPPSKVYALYPSHKSITPKVRSMLSFLEKVFKP